MEKKISERLKKFRLDHNLTQYEMCGLLGVSIATYNALENGKTNINTDTVDKISQLLKIGVKTVRDNL